MIGRLLHHCTNYCAHCRWHHASSRNWKWNGHLFFWGLQNWCGILFDSYHGERPTKQALSSWFGSWGRGQCPRGRVHCHSAGQWIQLGYYQPTFKKPCQRTNSRWVVWLTIDEGRGKWEGQVVDVTITSCKKGQCVIYGVGWGGNKHMPWYQRS